MNPKVPLITLRNGVKMPALGLGVFQSSPEQTVDAVKTAIANGYRLIDTAAVYFNEVQVGEGIGCSGIPRSDLFVTTKLWISNYGYEQTLRAFSSSLRKLGLDYLDLYLLHWPMPTQFEETIASYRAAEKLLADGRVRAIGVCNFNPNHLRSLIARTEVLPAVNQVELHPFLTQREVRDADARLHVITQSWSPIGGVKRYWAKKPSTAHDPLTHPVIAGLARKCGKTPAQVVLRWHIQHGLSAIPKSVHAGRIAENIDIFDFELTAGDMMEIDALNTGVRGGPDPEIWDTSRTKLRVED